MEKLHLKHTWNWFDGISHSWCCVRFWPSPQFMVTGVRVIQVVTNIPGFLKILLGLWLLAVGANVLADVRETKHNLIKSRDKGVDEKQVCVFCHTPVVEVGSLAEGRSAGVQPLWQKSLGDDFVFTIFDDIGRLGMGKPSVGSQSIACLSCHDSIQAFGVGRTSADHPFGVVYRGATKYVSQSGAVQPVKGDSEAPFREAQHLTALQDFRDVSQGTVEGRDVFWVSRNGITSRRTRNDLPLYGRSSSLSIGAGFDAPHIECSSCHDPHASSETFLRVSVAGSQLCLTCHDK